MRKAAVRDGDPTTTGGRVFGTASTIKDHGTAVALDGDVATCGNCKGTHSIFGTGKGISEKGRKVVVDNDSVLCPCGKNHVMVGSNPGYFLNSHTGAAGESSAATAQQSAIATYDDRFILRNANEVLARAAYAVQRKDGTFEYGETDGNGHTHLLVSTVSAERVNVYLAG